MSQILNSTAKLKQRDPCLLELILRVIDLIVLATGLWNHHVGANALAKMRCFFRTSARPFGMGKVGKGNKHYHSHRYDADDTSWRERVFHGFSFLFSE